MQIYHALKLAIAFVKTSFSSEFPIIVHNFSSHLRGKCFRQIQMKTSSSLCKYNLATIQSFPRQLSSANDVCITQLI